LITTKVAGDWNMTNKVFHTSNDEEISNDVIVKSKRDKFGWGKITA
jgi:hypothetical protein